jgi:thioester reductase-like protein
VSARAGSIFVTGATGYLGGYVVTELLTRTDVRLSLLVRGRSREEAIEKLWRGLQLHLDARAFWEAVDGRFDVVLGDLTSERPHFGIDDATHARLCAEVDSVLHIAASLNRKSEKACLNTNLRGTLAVIEFARAVRERQGRLRRYSHVSTVAVCGQRSHEVVSEDAAIDWNRSDYDPYGRTKKFCEHMARRLLPDVPITIFRPSIVMGDARRPETTQFDMVRAFCVLADLPLVPIAADARQDIVHADWVGRAIATMHLRERPAHDTYHLSAGTASLPAIRIAEALAAAEGRRVPRFSGRLERPFAELASLMMRAPRSSPVAHVGSLLHVFLPYITYDTVFDNRRIVSELGEAPTPFADYAAPLYRWAKARHFEYPYVPLPARPVRVAVAEAHRA